MAGYYEDSCSNCTSVKDCILRSGCQKRVRDTEMNQFKATRGELPGNGYPDYPDDLNTFAERFAYQRGIADARAIDRMIFAKSLVLSARAVRTYTFKHVGEVWLRVPMSLADEQCAEWDQA